MNFPFIAVSQFGLRVREARGETLTREEQALAAMEEDAVLYALRWAQHAGVDVPE